jgi:hypothetical protein
MRFAFVTDKLPRSGSAGHLSLNHAIVEWLRAGGHEVTILLSRPRLRWPVERYETAPVAGPGVGSWRGYVFAASVGGVISILAQNILNRLPAATTEVLRRKLRRRSYGEVDAVIGGFISPVQSAWFARRILKMSPDTILVDTIFRSPLLREPGLQRFNSVITAPDLFYRRHRSMADAGYRVHPPQLPRAMEAAFLCLGRSIAAIQPEEAAEIRLMCPDRPICITPMPAPPCPPPAAQKKLAGRLVFVGSDTLPNIDGLNWFFAEIWPLLQSLRPDVTLDLVGDCGRALGRLPPNVARLGRVANLSAVLHRAMLAIAPLRVGSGLKIKMLDYARHGLMTIATPESLQGFASAGAPFILAPNAPAFAEAIAAKLGGGDANQQEARKAIDYVSRHYGPHASFAGLAELLKPG